jgi:hypothetical protein
MSDKKNDMPVSPPNSDTNRGDRVGPITEDRTGDFSRKTPPLVVTNTLPPPPPKKDQAGG